MSKTVQDLFGDIQGSYDTRELAEQAISDRFAPRRSEFGPEYSLYQLLKWSYRQGLIRQVGGKFQISLEPARQLTTV